MIETTLELSAIIAAHRLWVLRDGGSRANLSGADLSGANLAGANLSRADLSEADLSRVNLSQANLSGADLSGVNLSGANLSGADLSGADLSEADLIDGGQRADGYRFIGQVKGNTLMILAGCRYFPIARAREHWLATRGGTKLGAETICILDHIEAVAKIRGMT